MGKQWSQAQAAWALALPTSTLDPPTTTNAAHTLNESCVRRASRVPNCAKLGAPGAQKYIRRGPNLGLEGDTVQTSRTQDLCLDAG